MHHKITMEMIWEQQGINMGTLLEHHANNTRTCEHSWEHGNKT
jgi:hypothetical protein